MPENELFKEISSLRTEQVNLNTKEIDSLGTNAILKLINQEDQLVAIAVEKEIPNIAEAVDKITEAFSLGGRLFYVGAGTSGRLGILDASECPPTFGTEPQMVQGIIAGGKPAVFQAQEGAEDSPDNGANEISERSINPPDVVVGLAASGRTPFVKGALQEAQNRGCYTVLITTVSKEQAEQLGVVADTKICPDVGAEVISGSTRMKSGTAQKLVLNMLTTASMIKLGKTFGNVMVDLQLTNKKLEERAKKTVMSLTGVGYDEAANYLNAAQGNVKTALVMIIGDCSFGEAKDAILKAEGHVRQAINLLNNKPTR